MKPHAPASVKIVVKKFGGTSVGTLERIEAVAEKLMADCQRGERPVVVASAMSGETNRLVALAQAILPNERGPAYDMLVASGEQVSIALLTLALQKRGLKAKPLLAFQLGIQTDRNFAKARIQKIDALKLISLVEQNVIPVVAGFQGVSSEDEITTLGRGGSDTTAVALACAVGADACEIYTDVPAVFSADPRIVPKAREIALMSFEEMMEMASLGSKVLHIRCVELAAKYNVRIHLRSSFEDREGSWIVPETDMMESPLVSAVTHEMATVIFELVPVPEGAEFLAELFARLSQRGVVIDIITQSVTVDGARLAFSVSAEDVALVEGILNEFLKNHPQVQINQIKKVAKLSVVGVGMRNHPGVAARFFAVLAKKGIGLHLVTTSEIKISAVIDEVHVPEAARELHTAFELNAQ